MVWGLPCCRRVAAVLILCCTVLYRVGAVAYRVTTGVTVDRRGDHRRDFHPGRARYTPDQRPGATRMYRDISCSCRVQCELGLNMGLCYAVCIYNVYGIVHRNVYIIMSFVINLK